MPSRSRRRPRSLLPAVAAAFAIALAACGAGEAGGRGAEGDGDGEGEGDRRVVRAAVAANLRDAFDEVAAAFARANPGLAVDPTYTASGVAYQQILAGAPFALLVSADSAYPAALDSAGRAEPGSRRSYARGVLVLWTSPRLPDDVQDAAGLTSGAVDRVAVANPETAPYGAAAVQVLDRLGLLQRVGPKLVIGQDVSQAAQFAAAGADAAFLPLSLARAPALAAGTVHAIPDSLYAPITQALAVVRGAPESAHRLAAFLAGPEAQAILARHGYRAP